MTTTYGDISPRTAAYASADLLTRALPLLTIQRFGQVKPQPKNKTQTVKFRRYNALALNTTALVEGVTPSPTPLTHTDINTTLAQYGDYIELTDVIRDTHEDPVLKESTAILSEQAAQTVETLTYNVVKAGTNVYYSNGTARTDVNTVIDKTVIRKGVKQLMRQNARMFTSIMASSPDADSLAVEAGYWAICHPDVEHDLRDIPGFVSVAQYGTERGIEGEIGSVEHVRFVKSTIFTSFADGGGAKGSTESTSGTSSDVYPVVMFGRDSFGIVPLAGMTSVIPMVVNPKPSDSDPLAQRGKVGWKTWHAAIILNDLWMVRLEVAATA